MICSPPGSSIPGISQARIVEWAAISFFNIYPLAYKYEYGILYKFAYILHIAYAANIYKLYVYNVISLYK